MIGQVLLHITQLPSQPLKLDYLWLERRARCYQHLLIEFDRSAHMGLEPFLQFLEGVGLRSRSDGSQRGIGFDRGNILLAAASRGRQV